MLSQFRVKKARLKAIFERNFAIRLQQHRSKGWKLIELSKPMAGVEARNFETLILRALKYQGADLGNIKVAGKFDGYTEAWTKSTFAAKSIKDLILLGKKYERARKTKSFQ